MTSNISRKVSFGNYDELASEATQECEDRCVSIEVEINKLKSALEEQ